MEAGSISEARVRRLCLRHDSAIRDVAEARRTNARALSTHDPAKIAAARASYAAAIERSQAIHTDLTYAVRMLHHHLRD